MHIELLLRQKDLKKTYSVCNPVNIFDFIFIVINANNLIQFYRTKILCLFEKYYENFIFFLSLLFYPKTILRLRKLYFRGDLSFVQFFVKFEKMTIFPLRKLFVPFIERLRKLSRCANH